MGRISRILTGFFAEDDGKSGLYEKADGTVWYRKPDGSEAEVGNGGSQPLLTATVTMQPADIMGIHSTPFPIVAAPGTGNVILPLWVSAVYLPGLTPYSNVDPGTPSTLIIGWGKDDSNNIGYYPATHFLQRVDGITAKQIYWTFPMGDFSGDNHFDVINEASSHFDNVALYLYDPTLGSGYSDGDGTIRLTTLYTLFDVS